jgi:hypothetical protein
LRRQAGYPFRDAGGGINGDDIHRAARNTEPMRRRDFLRTTTVAATLLAAPRISRAAGSKVLRFVPRANLANLDPIMREPTA